MIHEETQCKSQRLICILRRKFRIHRLPEKFTGDFLSLNVEHAELRVAYRLNRNYSDCCLLVAGYTLYRIVKESLNIGVNALSVLDICLTLHRNKKNQFISVVVLLKTQGNYLLYLVYLRFGYVFPVVFPYIWHIDYGHDYTRLLCDFENLLIV